MRYRHRPLIALAIVLSILSTVLATPEAYASAKKVVIIVGPVGAQTDSYRATGNAIAEAAAAAGATVVKVYSPRATWSRVRNAVQGANVIVYLGHGNGYPNPYGSSELRDRHNGWGLNRTTQNGDSDNWSRTMVYCGEKALLGTLTSSDGAAQWNRCGGRTNTDGIHPAANFVMIYSKACYTPGANEGWDDKATLAEARAHVRHYSYPVLRLGAGAYFATDIGRGGSTLVDLILRHPHWAFGDIARSGAGYDADAQRRFEHADFTRMRIWVQRTRTTMGSDYWYAYAGRPARTPAGGLRT